MILQKRVILGLLMLLLLATVVLISLCAIRMHSKKSSVEISKFIKQDDLRDLSLTIYYMSPFILTRKPISDTDLAGGLYEYKVTIPGRILGEHIDLLNKMIETDLEPVTKGSHLNARIYYVFETKKDDKIFSVSMWGENNSMFVNGHEVKENKAFYDIIMPFLPENAVQELQTYLDQGK